MVDHRLTLAGERLRSKFKKAVDDYAEALYQAEIARKHQKELEREKRERRIAHEKTIDIKTRKSGARKRRGKAIKSLRRLIR